MSCKVINIQYYFQNLRSTTGQLLLWIGGKSQRGPGFLSCYVLLFVLCIYRHIFSKLRLLHLCALDATCRLPSESGAFPIKYICQFDDTHHHLFYTKIMMPRKTPSWPNPTTKALNP